MAFQQLKVITLVPALGVGSLLSYPGSHKNWLANRKTKTKIITTQYDTAYISSCVVAYVPKPDRRETQQFAVSMQDLRVYLKIYTVTTLLMFSKQKYTCQLPAK